MQKSKSSFELATARMALLDPEIVRLNKEYQDDLSHQRNARTWVLMEINGKKCREIPWQSNKDYHTKLRKDVFRLKKRAKEGTALNTRFAFLLGQHADQLSKTVEKVIAHARSQRSESLRKKAEFSDLMTVLIPLLLEKVRQREDAKSWVMHPHFKALDSLAEEMAALVAGPTLAWFTGPITPLTFDQHELLRSKIFEWLKFNNRKSRRKAMSQVYQDALVRKLANEHFRRFIDDCEKV